MSEPAPTRFRRIATAATILRRYLMGLIVGLVIVAVMLPSHTLSWLRRDYHPWFGRPLDWLDRASYGELDLTHVVMFGGIALVAACLWPRTPWWRTALLLLTLAVGTELLQFWVPGRTPKFSDAYDDLIGAGIGLVVAMPFRWLARAILRS